MYQQKPYSENLKKTLCKNKNDDQGRGLFSLILATNSVMAQRKTQSFMANVSDDSAMKFRIWFANPEKAKVTISIQSETGNYPFSKRVSDAWYAQTFDFTGVEDHIYSIEIAKVKGRFREKILISTNTYTMRRTKVY